MVRGWIIAALAALSMLGCGAEEETATAQEPEPVRPVEVVTEDGDPVEPQEGNTEVETLRARVAELEQQLTACQQAQQAVPQGVDVPAEQQPTNTANGETTDNANAAGDERRDAGPRRRRDDTIVLPDPTRVIFGR